MEKNLKIFNGFGIIPTFSWNAAGLDYYIPNIQTVEQKSRALEAFKKSYNKTQEELEELMNLIKEVGDYTDQFYTHKDVENNIVNILMLYLGLYSYNIKYVLEAQANLRPRTLKDSVMRFMHDYLRFDENGRPGILVQLNDTLFINSGIKIALEPNTAGIFLNKSGMGNKGWDVRAQVVDEDYSGYVHLSLAFTKKTPNGQMIYCGDKASQMVIFDIHHMPLFEVSEDEYNNLMKDSKRGANGFGSTDVK